MRAFHALDRQAAPRSFGRPGKDIRGKVGLLSLKGYAQQSNLQSDVRRDRDKSSVISPLQFASFCHENASKNRQT